MAKMKELIETGVHGVQEMRRHIKQFVDNVLFAGQTPPTASDARYWPSRKSIVNCMYRTKKAARFSATFFVPCYCL